MKRLAIGAVLILLGTFASACTTSPTSNSLDSLPSWRSVIFVGSGDSLWAHPVGASQSVSYALEGIPAVVAPGRSTQDVFALVADPSQDGPNVDGGTLLSLNLATGRTKIICKTTARYPTAFESDGSGEFGYLVSTSRTSWPPAGTTTIQKVNLLSGSIVKVLTIGGPLSDFVINPDGTTATATGGIWNVAYTIDLATLSVSSTLTFGQDPRAFGQGLNGLTTAGNGSTLILKSGYEDGGENLLATIRIGTILNQYSLPSVSDPDDLLGGLGQQTAYVSSGLDDGLYSVDLRTGTTRPVQLPKGYSVVVATMSVESTNLYVWLHANQSHRQEVCVAVAGSSRLADCNTANPPSTGSAGPSLFAVL